MPKFPKKYKLSSHKSIELLFKQNVSFFIYPFRIVWHTKTDSSKQNVVFLFSVPKTKFKHAVKRNQIKRRIKEAVRLNKHIIETQASELNIEVHIAFVYVANTVLPYEQIQKSIISIFEKFVNELITNEM